MYVLTHHPIVSSGNPMETIFIVLFVLTLTMLSAFAMVFMCSQLASITRKIMLLEEFVDRHNLIRQSTSDDIGEFV
ncbi:hypothetical protein QR680_015797 [Steinernema hermaphroditum]|uniref:Uncharacterized protein n=1 Tax=Steinernema hermaphroditum TaxID=289476 RepID=A0AA39H9Y7_9BILA|nr:hypothetical protein QR680_015797 [Steinernema hermaphroditum]